MKIRKVMAPVGVAAAAIGMAVGTAIPAWAANNIKPFGQQETLNNITYTVNGLSPSSDAVPHNGQLYEAAVTVDGGGIPIVPMFNARAESGANYRVIGGGVPGKLYFDVVGDTPNSVVYNDGVQDLLVWVPGASEATAPAGAPAADTGTSEIIGGTELGGAQSGGPDNVAPAVAPPPEINPFEFDNNAPSHEAARGGR